GTQLTMRTFHIGGTATAGAQVNKSEAKTAGKLTFENVKTVAREDGSMVIMNKTGEIIIKNDQGAEKERYPAIYGATLFFKDGETVAVGDRILEWDPFAMPIMSEVAGTVKYEDLVQGATYTEVLDAVRSEERRVGKECRTR